MVATACTKPGHAQGRPDPSMERGVGYPVTSLCWEDLAGVSCWAWERKDRFSSCNLTPGISTTLQWKTIYPRLFQAAQVYLEGLKIKEKGHKIGWLMKEVDLEDQSYCMKFPKSLFFYFLKQSFFILHTNSSFGQIKESSFLLSILVKEYLVSHPKGANL